MEFHLTAAYAVFLPMLGAAVAILGTLVGLGGGFILVPILLFLFPEAPPATITTISLTVVLLNAASATVGNIREHRIDGRTSILLLAGAVPAAIGGAATSLVVSRNQFESLFGGFLILVAGYVLWRSTKVVPADQSTGHDPNRKIHERQGVVYLFYINELLVGIISPLAGFISSFFGIGGGVIHMPVLTLVLKMPFRVASATSLLVLGATSLTAILTLFFSGVSHEGWRMAGLLGLGALLGAQLGIHFGSRVNSKALLILLSAAMVLVGLRQLMQGLS